MDSQTRPSPPTKPTWMQAQELHPHHQQTPQVPNPSSSASDWVRAITPQGKPYWYSRSTSQTIWTDPLESGAISSNPTARSTAPLSSASLPNTTVGTNSTTSGVPPLASTNSIVKPVWRKTTTPDGKEYYYNRITKKTQWERPKYFPNDPPIPNEHPTTTAPAVPTHSTSNVTSTPDPIVSILKSVKHNSSHTSDANVIKSDDIALPPGWVRHQTKDGRPYFYHAATRKTSWKPPPVQPFEKRLISAPGATLSHLPQNNLPLKRLASTISPVASSVVSHPVGQQFTQNQEQFSTHEPLNNRAPLQFSKSQQTHSPPPPETPTGLNPQPKSSKTEEQELDAEQQKSKTKWIQHTAPDGRIYYYNPTTLETSWNRPLVTDSATSKESPSSPHRSPKHKRPRTTEPVILLPKVKGDKDDKSKKSGGNSSSIVQRPRDDDGKPLSDRESEKFFIMKMAIKRQRNALSKKKLESVDEEGESIKHRSSKENDQPIQENQDVNMVSKDAPMKERTDAFYSLLKERGMTYESGWIQTMARCCDDPRYMLLSTHGERKDAWKKFREKQKSIANQNNQLQELKNKNAFLSLLHELFDDEPSDVRSLQRCKPESVKSMEENSIYKTLSESSRGSLVRAHFKKRASNALKAMKKRRDEVLSQMSKALREKIDPSLFPQRVEERSDASKELQNPNSDGQENKIMTDDKVVKQEDQDGDNPIPENGKDAKYFTQRTPYRELEAFLRTLPGEEFISKDEISEVIRLHRRFVDDKVEDKRIREREARKRMQHENRVRFRSGILGMLLQGKLPFAARWKDVAQVVEKESFAKLESELGQRPSKLFEDGHEMFEERVQAERDTFKQLLKDDEFEITSKSTVDELIKSSEGMAEFIARLERPIFDALLVDRQRKEQKRRMKEKEKLSIELERMLRGSELGTNGMSSKSVTMETVEEKWKDHSVYQQLVMMAGEEGVKLVLDEFLRWKEKEERKKRKLDMEREQREQQRLDGNDRKRIRISGAFSAQEEENGWTAAVSKVSMTEEEKRAEKERRKREILESA